MSKSFFNTRKPSGNAPPEKSNFAQTCNLLSQYLKDKGSTLRDLNLGINGLLETSGRPEAPATTTVNLTENSDQTSTHVKSMNMFPPNASMAADTTVQDAINNNGSSERSTVEQPKTAQMTIFYAGQVFVFDDFSAAKAKEVMLLATEGSTRNTTGFVSGSDRSDRIVDNCGNSMPSASNILSNSGSVLQGQKETQPIVSDLPIARRASLNRFLEKRKDRASARAPYQLHDPSAESPKQLLDLNL